MGLFDDIPQAGLGGRSRDFAIRTILGEAGQEPDEGQAAVGAVIMNRLKSGRWGDDASKVVLAKSQFEPWMTQAGRDRMLGYAEDGPEYKRAAANFDRAAGGYDPTNGATHFYSPTAQAALGRLPPSWAQGEGHAIGRHTFFAPEGRVQVAQAQPAKPSGLFDDIPAQAGSPPDVGSPHPLPDTGGRFTDTAGQNFRVAREGESPTVVGKGQAFGGGVLKGLSFNFVDEIAGTLAAGGFDPSDPISLKNATALARGLYKRATGDSEADAAYRVTTSAVRDALERHQEQQPVASIAGELTGALAVPVGGAARGASFAARAISGARLGAGVGALAGAGAGEDPQGRALGALGGAGIGGIVGGAAPGLVEGVIKTGQGIGKLAQPLVQGIRGVRDVDAEAARRIVAAQAADLQQPTSRSALTPSQFASARQGGQPAVVGDIGGENVRALARSAADTSASGREALEAVTSERFKTQSPRTAQFLKDTFDYPDSTAALGRIEAAAARENSKNYLRAYHEGSGGIWDDALENLTQDPLVQRAIRLAFAKGQNKGAVEGLPPLKNPFALNRETGTLELQSRDVLPNLQFWDHVKRGLDGIGTQESRAVARVLREHLDTIVPSYNAARSGAAKFFGAEDAVEAGANFAKMTGSNALSVGEARKALGSMGDSERKLFETGFVSQLMARIEALKDGQDVVKQVYNSDFARKQIELALGADRARMLEAHLLRERAMDMLRPAVSGNSKTAQYLHQLGFAGGHAVTGAGLYSAATGNLDYGSMLAGGITAAAGRKIDARVSRRVAEMLASDNPAVLKKGLNIVARNDTLRAALRAFDGPAAKVGSQAPAQAIQGPLKAAAEPDQQN